MNGDTDLMYLIRFPAEAAHDGARYICRFKHVEEPLTGSVSHTPGQTTQTDERLAWVDGRTVAWMEEHRTGDGPPRIVTNRGRIALSTQVGALTLEELFGPEESGRGSDYWQPRVEMARWIVSPETDSRLSSLTRHLARRMPTPRPTAGTLLQSLTDHFKERSPNDGSRVLDALFYLHVYNRLLGLTHGTSWDDWREGAPPELLHQLDQLAHDLDRLNRLPMCGALRVAVSSVLHGRSRGGENARRLGEMQGTREALADEVGALSYGMPSADRALDEPCFLGISSFDFTPAHRPVVMYSGDPAFLRAYLTRITSTILIFPEVDFHVLILGAEDECLEFGHILRRYVALSAEWRRQPLRSTLNMSWGPVPAEVSDPKAYFASARILFARAHLEAFPEGLWIHDADLYPTADIVPFIPKLRQHDIGISLSKLQGGLLPWKRYLAGNLFLNATPATTRFLQDASFYLRSMLTATNGTWMVDQNALSWAAEQSHKIDFFDMLAARVPLTQSTLAARIERDLP